MKKLNMIFCGGLLVLTMSLTACGNYAASENNDSGQQGIQQQQEASQENEGKYTSIADYIASSDEVQQAIELLNNMEGLEINLRADGNKMIYEYKYTTLANQDGLAEQLKSALESQKTVFVQGANNLKEQVNIDNPIVTVTYIDKNGEVIYSQDFPAN